MADTSRTLDQHSQATPKTEFAKRNVYLAAIVPDALENAVDLIIPDRLEALLDDGAGKLTSKDHIPPLHRRLLPVAAVRQMVPEDEAIVACEHWGLEYSFCSRFLCMSRCLAVVYRSPSEPHDDRLYSR